MRIRDADGDMWEQRGDEWCEPVSNSWLPTVDLIAEFFGPISEVPE